jgi:hypothetical protein
VAVAASCRVVSPPRCWAVVRPVIGLPPATAGSAAAPWIYVTVE